MILLVAAAVSCVIAINVVHAFFLFRLNPSLREVFDGMPLYGYIGFFPSLIIYLILGFVPYRINN